MARMVNIDGSQGEGGGQVLRTSLALSAVTGRACRVSAIRAGRPRPGLAAQHLTGVRGAALLCDGEVEGAVKGSREITLRPRRLAGGELSLAVGTAGAVSLVLQVLVPMALAALAPSRITVAGGTDVAWSPPIDYFDRVYLEWLRRLGARIKLKVEGRGFYPRGGGRVVLEVVPWSGCPPLTLLEQPPALELELRSVATPDLAGARVAERQVEGFLHCWEAGIDSIGVPAPVVRLADDATHIAYEAASSTGSVLLARLAGEGCILGASALGQRGKRAERIGTEVSAELLAALVSGAPVDRWAGDQLVPCLGLAGGSVRTSEVTRHTRTNLSVVERFLPVRFEVADGTMVASG